MKISGGIFDMDGTLIDSMFVYEEVAHSYLEKIGLKNEPELEKLFLTRTALELAHIISGEYKINKPVQEIIEEINAFFFDFYANLIQKKEGISEFLKMLKSKNVKLALLTASDREIAFQCLKRNGLLDFFDEFVFCSEHKTSKREPEIFFFTQELLGTKSEETFVFEDALYAVKTAKKAGLKTCGIYDEWCHSDIEKMAETCEIYGRNWKEIKDLFSK